VADKNARYAGRPSILFERSVTMKTFLLLLGVASLLSGCVIAPYPGYYYGGYYRSGYHHHHGHED